MEKSVFKGGELFCVIKGLFYWFKTESAQVKDLSWDLNVRGDSLIGAQVLGNTNLNDQNIHGSFQWDFSPSSKT